MSTRTGPANGLTPLTLFLWFLVQGCGGGVAVDYSGPVADWPEYGGDKGGMRYSPLTQINAENVTELELAWVYHHGDFSDGDPESGG